MKGSEDETCIKSNERDTGYDEWLPHTSMFSNLMQSSSRYQRSYDFKKLYGKSSIKPPVAYLISDLPGGGLIERGLVHKIK